jgi:hypothetical protein
MFQHGVVMLAFADLIVQETASALRNFILHENNVSKDLIYFIRPTLALNQYEYPEQFFWVFSIRSRNFYLVNPNRERIPKVEPNGITCR